MRTRDDEARSLRECIAAIEQLARDPDADRSVIEAHRAKLLLEVRQAQQRALGEQATLFAMASRLEALNVDLAASAPSGREPRRRWPWAVLLGGAGALVVLVATAVYVAHLASSLFSLDFVATPGPAQGAVWSAAAPAPAPPPPPARQVPPRAREPVALSQGYGSDVVAAAMTLVTGEARRCSDRDLGRVGIDLVVDGRTGEVLSGTISSGAADGAVRSCIARAASRARFPRLGRDRVAVHHDWTLGDLPQTLSMQAIQAGMNRAVYDVNRRCDRLADGRTTVSVRVVIDGATGRVSDARVTGAQEGTAAGRCVAREFMGARFPRFSQPSMTVGYSVALAARR
jgi:hypothetical protein